MDVTIHLPDNVIVQRLERELGDLPRHMLESFAVECYRIRLLTTDEIRQLLGYETRFEVHELLQKYEVPLYTLTDLEQDRETLRRLGF